MPQMSLSSSRYTGYRENLASTMSASTASVGVSSLIAWMLGRGTMTSFTEMSVNSNTEWISSCSVESNTPFWRPSSRRLLISSSDTNRSEEHTSELQSQFHL